MVDQVKVIALVVVIAVGIYFYVQLLCLLIASLSGWRVLAKRFRREGVQAPQIGRWQSARMRMNMRYNNAIKVGADASGLYLSVVSIVFQHPPLLIPWSEITPRGRSTSMFWKSVTFELGHEEKIPFAISEALASEIERTPGVPPMNFPVAGVLG